MLPVLPGEEAQRMRRTLAERGLDRAIALDLVNVQRAAEVLVATTIQAGSRNPVLELSIDQAVISQRQPAEANISDQCPSSALGQKYERPVRPIDGREPELWLPG